MAEWSAMPLDLWGLIAERLGVADLIRFGSVCKSWRSISGLPRRGGLLPWLIVPYGCQEEDDNNDNDDDAKVLKYENFCRDGIELGVFSLHDRQVYRLELPEVARTRICGSSSTGWLATVQDNSEIKLIHAFTRSQIQLPPLTEFPHLSDLRFSEEQGTFLYSHTPRIRTFRWSEEQGTFVDSYVNRTYQEPSDYIREFYIDKLVIASLDSVSSAHPDAVIAIYGSYRQLALFRPTETETTADKSWILLGGTGRYFDVTYYGGRFYAVNYEGSIYVIDGLESSSPHLTVAIEPSRCRSGTKYYLVESSGELLMVSRLICLRVQSIVIPWVTECFYRCGRCEPQPNMQGVDHYSLFISYSGSDSRRIGLQGRGMLLLISSILRFQEPSPEFCWLYSSRYSSRHQKRISFKFVCLVG